MNKSSASGGGKEDSGIILVVVIIILFLLILFFYEKNRLLINTGIGWLIQGQLYLFAPFFEAPSRVLAWFSQADMGRQSFETMSLLMSVGGRYFRWLTIPLSLLCFWKLFSSNVVERYRYAMTAKKLIEHNAHFVPCLRPIAHRDLLAESLDVGPWRVAQQALQFAVANRLLLLPNKKPVDAERMPGTRGLVLGKNGISRENSPCLIRADDTFQKEYALTFDVEAALEIFALQMGERYFGKESLPTHMLGLAAAFMAFGFGHKDVAQRLLDHMSTTFREKKTEQGTVWSVDSADAETLFDEYAATEEIQELSEQHGEYGITFLMALLFFAKQKGLLACSEYIWLKPLDRTLWYALNQIGGKAAWAESAGPWAHYQFEEALGERVEEKQCAEAAKALRYVLEMEGWLPGDPARSKTADTQKPTPPKKQDPRELFQRKS